MDMINKLKNTVTGALPGNPVSREYEASKQIGSAGPGLLWKIYSGLSPTTKQEASVFVFEKKSLESFPRNQRDRILEMLKRGVSSLTRLRHPKILSVLHPLEESRESLAFATEPVFASLSNVLGSHFNLPVPIPEELNKYQLYDVEIKYGFLQILEAVKFLHGPAKMLHRNICPESIVIAKSGSWRLFGFDFSLPNISPPEQPVSFSFHEWRSDVMPILQPCLDYLAPEYIMTMSADTASDMYSLGILMYAAYSKGAALFQCNEQLQTYKRNVEQMRALKSTLLGNLPNNLRDHVKLMLNPEPSVRPDADQLSKVSFFDDVGVATLQYLDTLFQRENLERSQFFKGMPQVISQLPKRVLLYRVLPALFGEFVNPHMVPFVLPNILMIAEEATQSEFRALILPNLTPAFRMREPVQILLVFMQNMPLLLSKSPASSIRDHILPMVYHALESNTPQIQELCLNILPSFANLIEYSSMKNGLVPRLRNLCLTTPILSVRVNCLVCIGKLLEFMDKWFVLDNILPLLTEIPSREPGVLMSMLGIYKVTMTHPKLGITKEMMATKLLPFLIPLSIENSLNLKQFDAFTALINEMLDKVRSEQRSKLEQLQAVENEQTSLQFQAEPVPAKNTLVTGVASSGTSDTMMDQFISDFGITTMTSPTPSGNTTASSSQQLQANSRNNTEATKIPNQPAKVSLSLKEKQRLAREAEMQQRKKETSPIIAPYNSEHPGRTRNPMQQNSQALPKKKEPKDLTSTLINSNLMGLKSTPPQQQFQQSPAQPQSTTNWQINTPFVAQPQGFQSMTSIHAPSAGLSSTLYTGSTGQSHSIQSKPDLSAIDSLFPNQQKLTLNQLSTAGSSLSSAVQEQQLLGSLNSMNCLEPNKTQHLSSGDIDSLLS